MIEIEIGQRIERERILLLHLGAKATARYARSQPQRWLGETVALFEAEAHAYARAYARLRGWRFRRALRIGWRKAKASRVVQPLVCELRAALAVRA